MTGSRCDGTLGRSLREALGARAVFLPCLPEARPRDGAVLAVGLFGRDDGEASREFIVRAHAAGIPAIGVEERDEEILIGPLALPGRAGCHHCARMRMAAAEATDPASAAEQSAGPQEVAALAGPILVGEVRAALRRSPRASRLVDHLLAIDGVSPGLSLHRVVPLSRCPACGGASAFPGRHGRTLSVSAEDSPETILAALAGWVDPRTGIVSRLLVGRPSDPGTELPVVATAAPPHGIEPDGSLRPTPIGWGKGLTVSGAILSAVGEAIERYAPSLPEPARIVWLRRDDLEGDVLDPREFALYADAQYDRDGFPYTRFDPGARHPWVPGTWLGTGRAVWVPAVFAYLSLDLRPEHLICQGTSNGLAASTDPDEAALRATLELVERDAFMAAWLTASPGRRISPEAGLDPRLRSIIEGIRSLGANVELYVLPSSACGTTVLCLALGDGVTYPGVTIGLGCDLDPRSAFRQAVLELGQTGPHLRRLMRTKAIPVPRRAQDVREMLDHAAFYFPAERVPAFDRLRSHEAPIPLAEVGKAGSSRTLATCAAALNAAGIRVALVDVTSPDVATGPFRVMRAVSPDLQPISYGFGLDRQPVERVRLRGLAGTASTIHPIW